MKQDRRTEPIYATIDAGGTTFKCALIQEGTGIVRNVRVRTLDPKTTLKECLNFFKTAIAEGFAPVSMGISSFGPIDVDPNSLTFGMILDTPKLGWAGINLKQYFETALSIPVNIDTDVNGALLAEMRWGQAKGVRSAAYMTIGTGIGVGLFANGDLIGKPSHPEFGHIRVERHHEDQFFSGCCNFHEDCLEGLASAQAMTRRFGNPAELEKDHVAWDVAAFYLGQACHSISLTLRPDKIILGGGLMLAPQLIDKVRKEYAELINNYLGQTPSDIRNLIVTPALGDDAGLYGGARLAGLL